MGIRLPKIQIGKFIKKEVAPVIPGGVTVANSVDAILNKIKGKTSAGASVTTATQDSIREVNEEAAKKKIITFALIGGAILVLILMLRRR